MIASGSRKAGVNPRACTPQRKQVELKAGTVAIIGRPNSGKSTLLNALLHSKLSIVSDRPQTTRHRISGILSEARGQAVFIDTPGIHKPGYVMNRRMLRSVYEALNGVNLVLLMVDASISSGAGDHFVLQTLKETRPSALLLLNKIDLVAKPRLLPLMEKYAAEYEFIEIIPVSALKKDNIQLVVDKVFACLPEGEPLYESELITNRSERFFASEFIREKILERAREEVPYASAVLIRSFDESGRENKQLIKIEADILVEKKSQQGIILGTGGLRLKEVGIAARRDLEHLLECRVYLGLKVRTAAKWRDNDSILDEMELGT
jgi:GTP-binding protein Era